MKKIILGILVVLLLLGGALGGYLYYVAYGTNVITSTTSAGIPEDNVLVIPTSVQSINELTALLQQENLIKNDLSFWLMAKGMKYRVKAGKYKIPAATKTSRQLIKVLRGSQMSIKVTFHNFRVKEQLAGHLAQQIETDSTTVAQMLNDEALVATYGYTPQTIMAMFIPNTYEVYWNTTAKEFLDRMQKENKKFWNAERLAKAEALEMTPTEIYTLASIVEAETQYKPERPRVAGVYLNRLQTEGWKLEADPTVIFATGDFSIRRVLNRHLETDSPYNTYRYAGLPPGPIYMASISSIDAVLNHEEHNYMFFCAKVPEVGMPTSHAFAKTLRQHLNNARAYQRWLSTQ